VATEATKLAHYFQAKGNDISTNPIYSEETITIFALMFIANLSVLNK
jgi:hypothetical protein